MDGTSVIKEAPTEEEQKFERDHPEDHLHKSHQPGTIPLFDKPSHIELGSLETGISMQHRPLVQPIPAAFLPPGRLSTINPYIDPVKRSITPSFALPQYIVPGPMMARTPPPTPAVSSRFVEPVIRLPTPFDEPIASQRASNRSINNNSPWSNAGRRSSFHSRHISLPPYMAGAPNPLNPTMVAQRASHVRLL